MIKEAIGVADTVDEAKEKALAELNAAFDDDVQVEVLSIPKKKALGLFGGSQAKVRVSMEVPDPKPQKAAKTPAKAAKQKEKAPATTPEKPAARAEKPVKTEAAESAPVQQCVANEIPSADVDKDSPAGKAVAYLQSVLDKLGCTGIALTVGEVDGGAQITLKGEGLGVVIGHRGETLDALQYLVSLAANAGVTGYYRIVLNTGDFRQKREQTLVSLAKRMSDQAIKTGKCRTLEPMNPYERRIIHTTVQAIDGVTSTSFGEGSARRVVIAPEGKEPRPRNDFRNDRNDRGGRGDRGFRGDRGGRGGRGGRPERREAYKPEPTDPNRVPVKDADAMPLYGRIDK